MRMHTDFCCIRIPVWLTPNLLLPCQQVLHRREGLRPICESPSHALSLHADHLNRYSCVHEQHASMMQGCSCAQDLMNAAAIRGVSSNAVRVGEQCPLMLLLSLPCKPCLI
jgi:hypothetical protein